MREHFPRFRECYERGRDAWPGLAGTITVGFNITATGAVTAAEIDESKSSIADESVRACVRSEYAKVYFPRPVGGEVTSTYSIDFSHDGINARLREL